MHKPTSGSQKAVDQIIAGEMTFSELRGAELMIILRL